MATTASGGGSGGTPTTPTTPTAVAASITAATSVATNDTATTPGAAFAVVQSAGVAPVTVNSPPKVNFTVISDGAVVQGLTTSNARFIIAKLVPGTNGSPDQWESYTSKTVTPVAGIGPGTPPKAVLASATQPTTDTAADPGQLVYNAAGYYTYTFSTDIKDSTKTNGVVFDPNATNRVVIQLSYTNKAGQTVLVNPYFDFTVDASGNSVAVTDPAKDHKVVDISSCNQCHDKLALHGGGRVDTQYCVTCHNAGNVDPYSGNVLDMRVMVHKIHGGEFLSAAFKNNYTIWGYQNRPSDFSDVLFPQDLRNCTNCHDGNLKDAAGNTLDPQGDNWKNVPSRAACGSCHEGIDFATGKGLTLADAEAGLTTSQYGHVGGAQADDSNCRLCHSAAAIPLYHIPATPPNPANSLAAGGTNTHSNSEWIDANTDNLPAGAIKVTWDISSVSRNASKQPVIVFKALQNGTAVPFNDPAAKTEIWDNFFGSPSLYFVWAQPQDGIATPADFNASASTYLRSLWNGTATGTLTGPDASGYYTATLTGVTVPDNAVMLTGGIGYTYGASTQPLTQANLADYPVTKSTVDPTKNVGGLAVPAPNVTKVATGYTGRRAIVDTAKCNACHEKLGVFTASAFHAGQRNDANSCSWCHNPNRTSSGWAVDSEYFVHGIHGASKRTVPFTWQAASATDNFSKLGYPGILKNCETCHLPGTYDFSASASSAALPNRLFRTVATGTFSSASASAFQFSPYVTEDVDYGSGYSVKAATGAITPAAGTTLVISPIMTVCVSCHDGVGPSGVDDKLHMEQNGGVFYVARGSANPVNSAPYTSTNPVLVNSESCMLCHGTGGIAPIAAMHAK